MTGSNEARTLSISVVILNYNGKAWLARCLQSLRQQTIAPDCEIVVADNQSCDGSDKLAVELMRDWKSARFLQNDGNLGYCEGNNRGAAIATGDYLFFLNNDAWLEPDCLEKLLDGVQESDAQAAMPMVLDYADNRFQSMGAAGFDLFGWSSTRKRSAGLREVLMPEGCGYLIRRDWFERLGGFDRELFMYSDELDLSLRVWACGGRAVVVPSARMHHRGAVDVNPAGDARVVEFRTSDSKRYFANRNGLLVVAKCMKWLWLWMIPAQCFGLLLEAVLAMILIRRWGYVRRAYLDAIRDAWRLRFHIRDERGRLAEMRKRGDGWMLRFLKFRLNRWDELVRAGRHGLPRVSAR